MPLTMFKVKVINIDRKSSVLCKTNCKHYKHFPVQVSSFEDYKCTHNEINISYTCYNTQ